MADPDRCPDGYFSAARSWPAPFRREQVRALEFDFPRSPETIYF
jgi:hypothetical protein